MRLEQKSRLRILTALLIAGAALLLAMSIARGTEYVTNGNFEGGFSAAGVPVSWNPGPPPPLRNLESALASSPFTNLFPQGQRGVALSDFQSGHLEMLRVVTLPLRAAISFEFSLEATANAEWSLGYRYGGTPFTFWIDWTGGFRLTNNISPSETIAQLTAATWYQLDAVLDVAAGSMVGTLCPYGGSPVVFEETVKTATGAPSGFGMVVTYASGAHYPTVYLDNVSIRTVPEPSTAAMLCAGALVCTLRRRLRMFKQAA